MYRSTGILMILLAVAVFLLSGAVPATGSDGKKAGDNVQRDTRGVFDCQKNTVSNVEFYNTNYGIFGFKIFESVGGLYWPRGSGNQYIFAGGVWFGAQKLFDSTLRIYTTLSYNPNNGKSWFVPGRIEDGDLIDSGKAKDYRVYFSTDFTPDGQPLESTDGPAWPLWNREQSDVGGGCYVGDPAHRNGNYYPEGPAFVSDEDIFVTFKDSDLEHYDGGAEFRQLQGYPLGLQAEQTIYSWGTEQYRDFIIIRYSFKNLSPDTLLDCWIAPVYDMDIAIMGNSRNGASNDRARFFDEADSLNLVVGWTDTNVNEGGKGFGYIGFSFLATPAVDTNGYLRKDVRIDEFRKQIGMESFVNWYVDYDKKEDLDRYGLISTKNKDGDTGAEDKRVLFSTGPFNMLPGDTAEAWVCIAFALPAVEEEADGSAGDIGLGKTIAPNSLIDKILRSRKLLENKMIVGVNDERNVNSVARCLAYPNPASDYAVIELNTIPDGAVKYELYNATGEKQLSGEATASNRFSVNTSGLPAGCYVLKVSSGNNLYAIRLNVIR